MEGEKWPKSLSASSNPKAKGAKKGLPPTRQGAKRRRKRHWGPPTIAVVPGY